MQLSKKRLLSIVLTLAMSLLIRSTAMADGELDEPISKEDSLSILSSLNFNAKSVVVMNETTSQVLLGKNSEDKVRIHHFAKLMTLLIVSDALDNKEISLESSFSTSTHANSMGGTQIWLNVGEKISVQDLIKAISIGNANDAAVVLAEGISETEQEFVNKMNSKAKELGMKNTLFNDCTGISADSYTTAYDLALLSKELLKKPNLQEFFTTWMDNVRNGETELVNTNILVKSYKGITGMKSSFSKETGNCLIVTAKRDNLSFICVILGGDSEDEKFVWAKKLLDTSFSSYELFTPQIPKEYLKPIKIVKGEHSVAELTISEITTLLIPKGSSDAIEVRAEIVDKINAPVKENQVVGKLEFYSGDNLILKTDVITSAETRKMSFQIAFKQLAYKLIEN